MVGSRSLVVAVAPPVIATTGDTVSTVSVWVELAGFPAASETDMTTRCGPSERAAAVTDQAPPLWTSPVSVSSARVTVTVVPGATSAVPEMLGVGSLVSAVAPPAIVTAGAAVSTVSCLAVGALVAGGVGDRGGDGAGAVGQRGRASRSTCRPACTSAERVCASTSRGRPCPAATSLVPVIVGVGSFVVTDGPSSMVTTGSTVSTVSCWVALPGLPGAVGDRGDDRIGAVRQDRRGHRPRAARRGSR